MCALERGEYSLDLARVFERASNASFSSAFGGFFQHPPLPPRNAPRIDIDHGKYGEAKIGGFTPYNVISGEHVLFLASFHNNDVTLSQFQVGG